MRRNVAVNQDVDLHIVAGGLRHRGVDEGKVAGLDPLLGELARDEQLERGRGVLPRFDGGKPRLVDGGSQLRANDGGRLPPYFR